MKATSLPNLNHEPTSYNNFFTFFQDPNRHDDTTLHKRPNIDHSQVTEPSETSPFKAILSPFVSFNGSNENHYPVGGYFDVRDQNQMDQSLPRLPPSPTRSDDTTVSVGSNPSSGNVGARSEGPNFTQLRCDQTLPNTSSVGSAQLSGNVGARSEGPNVTQLQGDLTLPSMSSVGSYQSSGNVGARSAGPNFTKRRKTIETWTKTTPDLIDDDYAWRKYGQKLIPNATHPRNYYRCRHRFDEGCCATKQVQKTDEDPPMFQTTYHGNHTCRDPPQAPHIILDSTIPNDCSKSNFIRFSSIHYPVRDQNQMDQTLPRMPPTRSSDTTVSVGSNPLSGNVGARSEGPNFTQLRWDQTLPNTSSVGSAQLSGNVGARSEGPNVTQLQGDLTLPSMSSVGSYQSSGNVGARSAGPNFTKRR